MDLSRTGARLLVRPRAVGVEGFRHARAAGTEGETSSVAASYPGGRKNVARRRFDWLRGAAGHQQLLLSARGRSSRGARRAGRGAGPPGDRRHRCQHPGGDRSCPCRVEGDRHPAGGGVSAGASRSARAVGPGLPDRPRRLRAPVPPAQPGQTPCTQGRMPPRPARSDRAAAGAAGGRRSPGRSGR